MLPEEFTWEPRHQYAKGELALRLGAMTVAQLMRKVTGEWFAELSPYSEMFSPLVFRDCVSRESGIAGIEAWACRHEAHLREQAAMLALQLQQGRHPAVRKR